MVLGIGLLTLNDATVKWLSAEYPVGQIVFVRGLLTLVPIAVLARLAGGFHSVGFKSLCGQSVRAGLFVASTFLFLSALSLMPLASAVAIGFTSSLFLTALAVPVLGERVGWRRWSAVVVGFTGVMVMMRPSAEIMVLGTLLALGAALTDAARDLATRKLCATETSIATLLFSNLAITLSGLLTLPFGWQPLPFSDFGLLAAAAVLLGCANYLLIETFRYAEASLVSPFKYTAMVWAILFAFLIWGDVPDPWLIVGAGLVIGSGLYIFRRESRAETRP